MDPSQTPPAQPAPNGLGEYWGEKHQELAPFSAAALQQCRWKREGMEGSVLMEGSRREQEGSVPPTPSLADAQKPPQCQPRGYSTVVARLVLGHCCLLPHCTEHVMLGTVWAAPLPSLMSCSHYVICGPALPPSHKKGGRGREGSASPALLVHGVLPEQ